MKVVDMSYKDIVSMPDSKEKVVYLKEYKMYIKRYINKLYTKASSYKSFKFPKDQEEMTLKEMAMFMYNFLEEKSVSKEDIRALFGVKK